MKTIGIVAHHRNGQTVVFPTCEEHVPVALRAIYGESMGGPFSEQEPTGEVVADNRPCLVCVWLDIHGSDPLAPITVKHKEKIRQNIVTKERTP